MMQEDFSCESWGGCWSLASPLYASQSKEADVTILLVEL